MLHEIIQLISNIPLSTVLTVVMIVLLAISFIFGFLRGSRKSLFYTVFYTLAFGGFLLTFNNLTNAVLDASLDSIIVSLRSSLEGINGADLSEMFVKGTESYTFLVTMVSFVIQICLCLGFIVLFQIVYKILIWLIWVLIGRHFFKTKVKVHGKIVRKSKQRIFGGLIGLIPGALSVIMLFVPISGVFSVASSFTKIENKENVSFGSLLSEEDYQLLQKSLGAYEESVPGKIFNMSTSEDGRSFDLVLLDRMITVTVDKHQFNIRHDLEKLGEFTANIVSTGLLDVLTNDVLTPNDLLKVVNDNEEVVEEAFNSLGEVEIIDLVLNTGVEYLDKSQLVDNSLELAEDSVDYKSLSTLDWSSEFAQMGKILISAVEVLDVLPDEEKNKPISELSKFNLAVLDNVDSAKFDSALTNFVDTLFDSVLINEASTAGLAYIFNNSSVKEIVGEVDKEELKKIVLKDELNGIVDALVSVINIGTSNFANFDLKALSNSSLDLHNIINSMLGLGLYELVETNVLNYVVDNYLESNENITKFIDVNELKNSINSEDENRLDLKKELNAIVDTFERLGKETALFDVEELEDQEAILNYNAIDSKTIRILNDHLSDSKQIQKFVDKAMEGALVPTLFTSEEYSSIIDKPNFSWYDSKDLEGNELKGELAILADLIENVEKEYEEGSQNFSLYSFVTSSEKEITVAMLKGFGAKVEGEDDEYILDNSIFASEMIKKLLVEMDKDNALLDEDTKADIEGHYGRELHALALMLEESKIVESNYEGIQIENLVNEFNSLNDLKLRAIGNNIGQSEIMKNFIIDKVEAKDNQEGILSLETVEQMKTWDDKKWKEEFYVLADVLFDEERGLSKEESLSIDELNSGYDEINYHQLDLISEKIDNSIILQELLKTSLEKGGFDVSNVESWSNEIEVIRDVVGSETDIGNGNYKDINMTDLSSFDTLRPETLDVIADNINKGTIIKEALISPMRTIMGISENSIAPTDPNDSNYKNYPENWDNTKWTNEMKSLAHVAKPLAKPNSEKIEEGYPSDYTYININNLDIEGEIKLEVLENMKGVYISNEKLERRIFGRVLRAVSKDSHSNYQYGIHNSIVLQKLFRDAISNSYKINFDEYTSEDYFYEVDSLLGLIESDKVTFITTIDNEDYIVFDNLTNSISGDEIKLTTLAACRDNIQDSKLMQQIMKDNLVDIMKNKIVTTNTNNEIEFTYFDYDYSSWDDERWYNELNSLYEVAETLATDGVINLSGDLIGETIKYSTIIAINDNSDSDLLRYSLRDTLDGLLDDAPNAVENNTSLSCLKLYNTSKEVIYPGWDDDQWQYEMQVLQMVFKNMAINQKVNNDLHNYELNNPTATESEIASYKLDRKEHYSNDINSLDNVELNPNTMSDNLTSFDKDFLKQVSEKVYGVLDGASEDSARYNSYILQMELVPALEQVMNSGDVMGSKDIYVDERKLSRYRYVHPEEYIGANANTDEIVPKYSSESPKNDEEVGEWWKVEMEAIYAVVNDKFGDDDEIPAGDIEFDIVKISTLNIIKEHIEYSYVLQSAMRNTTEVIMNNADSYDDIITEDWGGSDWVIEVSAIRDVAKTMSTNDQTKLPVPSSKVKFNNSLFIKRSINVLSEDTISDYEWVKDTTNDENNSFYLWGMNIKDNTSGESSQDNVTLDTLYWASSHADKSEVIQRLLRSHIAEILGTTSEENPISFVEEWNNTLYPGVESFDDDKYANRWRYEMEALFNVASKMATEGEDRYGNTTNPNGTSVKVIQLKADMFDEINIEVFDVLNGAFTDEGIIDSDNIHEDHGYVANYNGVGYQSEIVSKMLLDSLSSETYTPDFNTDNTDEKWAYEIYALSEVVKPLAIDGKVNIKTLNFNDGINMDVLLNLSKVIHYSTYMQDKLNDSLFVKNDNDELKAKYPQYGFSNLENQWNAEIKALYNVVNGTNYVDKSNMFKYNNLKFDAGVDMDVLANLSTVIHHSTYMQNKLNESLFVPKDEHETDTNKIEELNEAFPKFGFSENKNQWNSEVEALYNVVNGTKYVDENNMFNYNNLNFGGTIYADVLENIGTNINYSTYLQYQLESTIEGLMPEKFKNDGTPNPYYVQDRKEYFEDDFYSDYTNENNIYYEEHYHEYLTSNDVSYDELMDHTCKVCGYIKEYHLEKAEDGTYYYDIKIRYNDENYHAWSVELNTIFGIILDDNSGLKVNNQVNIADIEGELHELSSDILSITADKLDKYGHDAYHSSNLVRINLIRPLEEFAYNTSADNASELDKKALISYESGFKWIDKIGQLDDDEEYDGHEFEFTKEGNVYNISGFHFYDSDENTLTMNDDGKIDVSLKGWKEGSSYIHKLNETLELDSQNSTNNKSIYIKKDFDRNGKEVIKYMLEIDENNSTGKWYCIVSQSDLRDLKTFFDIIGANNLGQAQTLFGNAATNEKAKYLATHSYIINQAFVNRGLSII